MTKKRKSLGLRFSNSDYSFSVMEGFKNSPGVIECGSIGYPKGFSRAQTLKWLVHEIESIFERHKEISIIVLKRFEGMAKGNSYEERVEGEATAFIAAANTGIKAVYKKKGATIAKDLGLKGKAKLLKAELDTSVIPEFENYSEKVRDAVLAGWSELQ